MWPRLYPLFYKSLMLFRYVGKWLLVFKSTINYLSLPVRHSAKYELTRSFKIYSEYFARNTDSTVGLTQKDPEAKVIANRSVFSSYCSLRFIFHGSSHYFQLLRRNFFSQISLTWVINVVRVVNVISLVDWIRESDFIHQKNPPIYSIWIKQNKLDSLAIRVYAPKF